MADVTMCKGKGCPMKEYCYRYTVNPSDKWQSYFFGSPYNRRKKKCSFFILGRGRKCESSSVS